MKRRHLLALWLALSPAAHADDALLPALQLSGFAKSSTERNRAAEIARGTPGVRTVRNDIAIRP